MRLGNSIHKALSRFGITPESYIEIKRAIGAPPVCHCHRRIDWLNKIPKAYSRGGITAAKEAHAKWVKRWEGRR